MEFKKGSHRLIIAGIAMMGASAGAQAQDEAMGLFETLWSRTTFVGTVRSDTSYHTANSQNYDNQGNMPFQHSAVPRQAYVPPALSTAILGLPVAPGQDWLIKIPTVGGALPFSDTVRRDQFIQSDDKNINYQQFRFAGEMNLPFTDDLRINIQTRALFDPDLYTNFDARSLANTQGGIPAGGADRYADLGLPNQFQSKGRSGKNLNPLELAGRRYMIDFPTAILEYKHDTYNIRIGNQQIAWGQAIFFQSFDVPNGLDFRRHLVIDRAIEEFSDRRVPALSVRGTMQVTDEIVVDGYVSKFQPSVIPNPNTPYNVAPAQFYKPIDNYHTGNYDWKLNYGIKLKSDYGNWGYSAIAVSRYNPLGVFSWARSGINKGLTGTNPDGSSYGNLLGATVEAAYAAKVPCGNSTPNPTTCRQYGSVGEALANSPLVAAPGGVYSNKEWFSAAGSLRLNGLAALNKMIEEFPSLQDVYATQVSTVEQASNLLNTFFFASDGSIRGNVQRDYYRESVFGLGGSYVNEMEDINSFWNQFIINVEAQYTPNRRFTDPDLGQRGIKSDEYIISAVAEKWYRYTEAFPAAYLAFEYQHRSDSDLVGLNLRGYGGNSGTYKVNAPTGGRGNDYTGIKLPGGISGADYLVFAGFQPTPNRKFVFEWAILWDVKGGLLAQPNVRWSPGNNLFIDVFYTLANGHLYGTPSKNLIRQIDSVDELNLRIGYQL